MSERETRVAGLACGSFDFLHPGHLIFLSEAKSRCDLLFVGLQVDPSLEREGKRRPVMTLSERAIAIDIAVSPHRIIPYQTELEHARIMAYLSGSYRLRRFVGEDYVGEADFMLSAAEEAGAETIYLPRSHGWSSTEFFNRTLARLNTEEKLQ